MRRFICIFTILLTSLTFISCDETITTTEETITTTKEITTQMVVDQFALISYYFDNEGFNRYQYNNEGLSVFFALHDQLKAEEILRLNSVGISREDSDYFGFTSYVFANNILGVIVMEFASENFLLERLAESVVLQEHFVGKDSADYVNGNCLLVIPENQMENYDYYVSIFLNLEESVDFIIPTETTTVAD